MNKKLIEELAGMLNLNAEELAKGIASEEDTSITLPKGTLLSDSDLETLKDNHGKQRYDAGKAAEREVLYKNLSKEAGLETIKNHDEFIKAYQAKILEEAQIEPEKKVNELSQTVESLQAKLQEKDTEFVKLQDTYKQKDTRFQVQSLMPELPQGLGLNKDEATSLFFISHEIKEDGVYKNGQLLKDNLERPIAFDQAVTSFVSDRGWNATPEGRGGGANGGKGSTSKITSYEDYEAVVKEKGYTIGSAEANALLQEAAKENPQILD